MYTIEVINELRQMGTYTCTFGLVVDGQMMDHLRIDKNFDWDITDEELEIYKEAAVSYLSSLL